MTKAIEQLKAKHAAELAKLEKEIELSRLLPEFPDKVESMIHLNELYGVSGSINIKPGLFGSEWAPVEVIHELVSRFPTIPLVEVSGDYRSVLMKDKDRRNYRYKINTEADIAPFWLESHGIPSSNHIELCWLTQIGEDIIGIDVSMNPTWGFKMSMKCRYSRDEGVLLSVSDVSLCHPTVAESSPKHLRFASGPTSLNTCRVTFWNPELSLINYVNAVCK